MLTASTWIPYIWDVETCQQIAEGSSEPLLELSETSSQGSNRILASIHVSCSKHPKHLHASAGDIEFASSLTQQGCDVSRETVCCLIQQLQSQVGVVIRMAFKCLWLCMSCFVAVVQADSVEVLPKEL